MAVIHGYEFHYETLPAMEGDPPVPGAFMIGGITDEVATGILAGMQAVLSIANVTAAVVTSDTTEFLGTEGALRGTPEAHTKGR
jgi:hypothetical protein